MPVNFQSRWNLNTASATVWEDVCKHEDRIRNHWEKSYEQFGPQLQFQKQQQREANKTAWYAAMRQSTGDSSSTVRPNTSLSSKLLPPYRYSWLKTRVPSPAAVKDAIRNEPAPDYRNQGPRTRRAGNCMSGLSGALGPLVIELEQATSRGSKHTQSERPHTAGAPTARSTVRSTARNSSRTWRSGMGETKALDQLWEIREALCEQVDLEKQLSQRKATQEQSAPYGTHKNFGEDIPPILIEGTAHPGISESGIMFRHARWRKKRGRALKCKD